MTLFASDRSVQERPTAIVGRPPELLVQACQILAESGLPVADQVSLAEAGTDEVDDNFCLRHWDQLREMTDSHDFEELGQGVPDTGVSTLNGRKHL